MCDVLQVLPSTNDSNHSRISFLQKSDRCVMQEEILVIFLPLVIIFGTLSNCICMFVFKRRTFRNMSVAFYLYIYSIVNLLNLYFSYGMSWLSLVTDISHFENYTDWGCRIWQFLYRIVAYSGVWLLVSALIDRYIALCLPFYSGRMCRVFIAKVAVVIVFTGICFISVHAMWSYELRQNICVPIQKDLYSIIWIWMSACCYVFIPLLTLLTFKLAMLLEYSKCRTGSLPKQCGVPSNLISTVTVLSGVYLLMALPATIVNIIDYQDVNLMFNFEKFRFVSNLLSCLNPAVMFLICFVMSKSFRVELVTGFQSVCCQKENSLIITELPDGHQGFEHIPDQSSDETLL